MRAQLLGEAPWRTKLVDSVSCNRGVLTIIKIAKKESASH